MEHFRINDKLRMELVKAEMAPVVFQAIDRDREYLKQWLPFVNYTSEVADTEKFLQAVSDENNQRDTVYSIWYKEEFAGLIGFKDTDWENRKTEIGYWLSEKMQGKGIVTACVKQLIEYAFARLKMFRIQIKVAEGNHKSEAIPKKLNFTFEGIERGGERDGTQMRNLRVYSLIATDRFNL